MAPSRVCSSSSRLEGCPPQSLSSTRSVLSASLPTSPLAGRLPLPASVLCALSLQLCVSVSSSFCFCVSKFLSLLGCLDLSLSVSLRTSSRAVLFKPQVTTV